MNPRLSPEQHARVADNAARVAGHVGGGGVADALGPLQPAQAAQRLEHVDDERAPVRVRLADPEAREEIVLGDVGAALFDRLASLTRVPDGTFTELRGLYDGDERLRVPAQVFNAVLNRVERISTSL